MGTSCMYVCHVHRDTSCYVILVRTRTFDIYVRHDIMQVFPFLWRSATCIVLYLSKTSLWGTYMSPPCESMCTCMGRVWGSTTHPTLPETEKSPGHITILKERSQSCYLCNCITNLNNWMTYWEFLKILKSRVTLIFFM